MASLLDDGTTVGVVVLRGAALELLPLLEPEDAINATGRVEQLPDGPAVVVDDPGGIVQAGDPIAPTAAAAPTWTAAAARPTRAFSRTESASPPARRAGLLDGPSGIGAGFAGFATLVALSVASLVVTLARRAHARRRIEARVAARVAALGASAGPSPAATLG